MSTSSLLCCLLYIQNGSSDTGSEEGKHFYSITITYGTAQVNITPEKKAVEKRETGEERAGVVADIVMFPAITWG